METYLQGNNLNRSIESHDMKSSITMATQRTHVLRNNNNNHIVKYDLENQIQFNQSDIKKKSIDLNQSDYQRNQQENCLIHLTDCEGETPLHAAVTSGNSDMVKVSLIYIYILTSCVIIVIGWLLSEYISS